jgi:hypothetical protein
MSIHTPLVPRYQWTRAIGRDACDTDTLALPFCSITMTLCFFGGFTFSPSTSSVSCKDRKTFLSPTSHMLATSKSGTANQLRHSSNEGRRLGSCTISSLPIGFKCLSSFPNASRRYRRTRPHDHRSALIRTVHRRLLDIGRHPMLRPALVVNLFVLVLHLHSVARTLIHAGEFGRTRPD